MNFSYYRLDLKIRYFSTLNPSYTEKKKEIRRFNELIEEKKRVIDFWSKNLFE